MNIEQDFKTAATSAGIHLDGLIIADGVLHRLHLAGQKAGSKNGAYKLHLDGRPAGWAMDYTTGNAINWSSDGTPGKMSKADWQAINAVKLERQKEREQAQQQAALKARKLWRNAVYADAGNIYCYHKGIEPHGAKRGDAGTLRYVLIVPLYNDKNKLVNLQFIGVDGTKRFLTGGRKQGCYWALGAPTDTILICEGFATGASLFEAKGLMTVIAFDAGNLTSVAQIIRAQNLKAEIVICGDNDLSGVGQRAANDAALAVGGKIFIPPKAGNDWNDHLTSMEASA